MIGFTDFQNQYSDVTATCGGIKRACVEDEAASSVCAAVSSHSVPEPISSRVAKCPSASDVDLNAEIERYEKELLELQEEENLLRQTLELERMKRESEVKNERVKNVRELRKVTIVSDGIPRDATGIDGVTLQTHCDATISEITDKVQSGEVTLQDFDYVIFHVGTHDVSNKASFEDIISDFGNLIGICRNTKPGIKITISAIVPRLVDDEETEPLLKKINGYLDKTMSKKINFKFIRTYRPFIYCGKIRPEFYAKKKGINLNAEGTRRIRHFFLRVISTM